MGVTIEPWVEDLIKQYDFTHQSYTKFKEGQSTYPELILNLLWAFYQEREKLVEELRNYGSQK